MDKFYYNRVRLSENELLETVKAYHAVLRNFDTNLVLQNFYQHVTSSQHPPTVADLVKQPTYEKRLYVPDAEETKLLTFKMDGEAADRSYIDSIKEDIEKKLEEGRKIHEQRIAKLYQQ